DDRRDQPPSPALSRHHDRGRGGDRVRAVDRLPRPLCAQSLHAAIVGGGGSVKLRILSESDVRCCLDLRAAVDMQAQAFALLAAKRTVEGLRTFVTSETPPAVTIFNPSYLKDAAGFGIKVVSDFLGNDDRTVPRMSALAVLFCGETGLPRTVMEA